MKKLIIFKPSSIGDIFHVFPALDMFMEKRPEVEIHWFVDEIFVDVVKLFHRKINIYSVNRKHIKLFNKISFSLYSKILFKKLQKQDFDLILDLSFRASDVKILKDLNVPIVGISRRLFNQFRWDFFINDERVLGYYDRELEVKKIWLNLTFKEFPYVDFYRQIFATLGSYLDQNQVVSKRLIKVLPKSFYLHIQEKTVIFFHSSSGNTKNWKIEYWKQLAQILSTNYGFTVYLPWFGEYEHQRVVSIADGVENCVVLPSLEIEDIAKIAQDVTLVIGCDTGFTHMATLLGKNVARIWGSVTSNAAVPSEFAVDFKAKFDCSPCGILNNCPKVAKGNEPVCYDDMKPEELIKLLIASSYIKEDG